MIDWSRVQQLQEEVGAEDFDEVVELFMEEVGITIDKLRGPEARRDLEDDLHFLKGSCLNLGFDAFAALCQAGETAAANGNPDSIDIDAILKCFDTTKAVFLAEYQGKLAA